MTNGSAAGGEGLTGTGLHVQDLSKTFTVGRKPVVALEHATLHTDKGAFLSLLGPSGCGKSTILRILAGLETATSGATFVDGKTPAEAWAATPAAPEPTPEPRLLQIPPSARATTTRPPPRRPRSLPERGSPSTRQQERPSSRSDPTGAG